MSIKIFPSILSADFGYIAQEVKKIEKSKADGIHIDIMDGHFVPNLSMGPKMVETIRKNTSLFLDVHLMMYNPFDYIEKFIKAGADMIGFHFEATEDVEDILNYIKRCNRLSCLVFNLETTLSMIPKYLDKCDAMLFMGVKPGFSGQQFNKHVLEKVEFTRNICNKFKKDSNTFNIFVDGGINLQNANSCIKVGANGIISGNWLFSQKDMGKAIEDLKNL